MVHQRNRRIHSGHGFIGSSDELWVRSFGLIWIRISDPRSLGSWSIKGTDESILVTDSSVPLMHHDLPWSWITDPDPDYPKGTHPMIRVILDHCSWSRSSQRNAPKVSGCVVRLVACLFILTRWTRVNDWSVLIATTRTWKTKVSSYHLKLTNKNILLHLSAAKTNFKTQQCSHS